MTLAGFLFTIEVRPHICTALAADPAGEALLDIGQSGIIGPAITADRDRVAAAVIRAVDQETANEMTASGQKRKFGPVVRFATMVVTVMKLRDFVSVGN